MMNKAPVTQTIAHRLQEMIRTGELKKGEKIPSQRVLSDTLQVSRPTLREALLTLETLGLVKTLPARGTFVVDQDREREPSNVWRYDDSYDIRDVFQSRILIEGEICRLAAGHLTPDILERIERSAGEFEDAWRRGDLIAHVEADLAFHRAIVDACPNKMLRRLYSSVQDLLTESQRQPIPNTATNRMNQSMKEHRKIAAALRAVDGPLAGKAMREHIRNTAACAGIAIS
jgi:GntR family transcriptional repressor for pyruvate dehydrogenase complex